MNSSSIFSFEKAMNSKLIITPIPAISSVKFKVPESNSSFCMPKSISKKLKLKSACIHAKPNIKEGKKIKEANNEETALKKDYNRQNRLNRDGRHQVKPQVNNRQAYLLHMRKQESSLDSEDGLKRKRAASVDSEDLNIGDSTFYKA